MKKLLSSIKNKVTNNIAYRVIDLISGTEKRIWGEQVAQLTLKNQYRTLAADDVRKYGFDDVGFRRYSQNSEDGILLFIFSLIGTTNKTVVEICASDGIQCNAANLLINHGWYGLLIDGDQQLVTKGKEFYSTHHDTYTMPPKFVHAWVTKDNVNNLITENDISGEIDLLSIDMDGMDYWIWDEINCIIPRVVIAEVQCILGNEMSVTVPYDDNFSTELVDGFGVYCGASIRAFVSLAKKKNYRLIGFERYGFNAFFMREDVGVNLFPEISTANYENIPFVKWAKGKFFSSIKNKKWQEVP